MGGIVVTYSPHEHGLANRHESVTRIALSNRLAALKGYDFGGAYSASSVYAAPVYFVPSDVIVGIERAHKLGIRNEHDLFGGAVPKAFVGTKSISHSLLDADAYAPAGWSHEIRTAGV